MKNIQDWEKFRAWDKKNKKMYFYTFDDLLEGKIYTYPECLEYEWSKFTGLKDKNGVEIYEGDIVGYEDVYHFLEREGWGPRSGKWKIIGEKKKNFTGKGEEKYIAGYMLYVVEWVDTSCGFEPFSDSEENCHHCGGGMSPKDLEVIGNIYENPELLEDKK